MRKSVFISHSSRDKRIADELCVRLEAMKIGCWIAPRDVSAGRAYGEAIIDGLRECAVCLLLLSEDANKSPAVCNEIERAFSLQKLIVPLRIRNVMPGKAIEFFVSNSQWVDAFSSPIADRVEYLAAVVQAAEGCTLPPSPPPQRTGAWSRTEQALERALRYRTLSAIFAVLLLTAIGSLGVWMQRDTQTVVQAATNDMRKAAEGTQRASASIENSATSVNLASNKIEAVSGKIGSIEAGLQDVKKERSDDPRKELANIGLPWRLDSFYNSVEEQNIDAVTLYAKGGMKIPSSKLRYYIILNHRSSPYAGANLQKSTFPEASLLVLREHNALERADEACLDLAETHIDLQLLQKDVSRLAFAKWVCNLSPRPRQQLDQAIETEEDRVKTARSDNETRPGRQKDCQLRLQRQFPFQQVIQEATQFNIFQRSNYSTKEVITARVNASLIVGDKDLHKSYIQGVADACEIEDPAKNVNDSQGDYLRKMRKLLF